MATLTADQTKAVENACKNRVSVLTGGPGTGKTFTTTSIIKALAGTEIAILAPTGKAAKRASEVTNREASTIHRFIGKVKARISKNEPHGIPQAIIIDECSMVDATLFGNLLNLLNTHRGNDVRLILVGDVDQLPSIGAGRVLGDIIDSGKVPVVRLTQTMRQAENSLIVKNAKAINEGNGEEIQTGEDFEVVANDNPAFLIKRIQEAVSKAVAGGLNIYKDIQIIVGQKRSELGSEALNEAIRASYNPAMHNKAEYRNRKGESIFRVGDKVIVTENDYELCVVNGDQGVIKSIIQTKDKTAITVAINEREVCFDGENIDMLQQGWAVTVHRAQGSEYPLVIVVSHGQLMSWAIQRALVYTAITRGKQCVKVFCKSGDLAKASNNPVKDRYTRLEWLLRG